MKHVVKFRESDSWSGVEIWHRGYDTEQEARDAAHDVNNIIQLKLLLMFIQQLLI